MGVYVEAPAPLPPRRLFVRYSSDAERRRLLSIAGAHEGKEKGQLTLPADPFALRAVRDMFNGTLSVGPQASLWEQQWQKWVDRSIFLRQGSDAQLSYPWADRMYPFQRVGARWLRAVNRGLLGDEPGLGKTVQALTAAHGARRCLIVTLNGVREHWARHVREWIQEDCVIADGDTDARREIIRSDATYTIVNREMLRGDRYPDLHTRRYDVVILDEAHSYQDRTTQQSVGASRLKASSLYLLTGTPVWNMPSSIWHLLALLHPDRFTAYWRFVDEYCAFDINPWARKIVGPRPDKLGELHELLAPYMLKRLKTDREVDVDLPDKLVHYVDYKLSPVQYAIADAIEDDMLKAVLGGNDLLAGIDLVYQNAVAKIADLRRLCNDVELLRHDDPAEQVRHYTSSPKTGVLLDLLEQIGDRKTVIFVWHNEYAEYLSRVLQMERVCHTIATGRQSQDARLRAAEHFRSDSDVQVLIATIGSMGTGIDLVQAKYAIFAEASYTPAENLQAEDRLHRIGQRVAPTIYRLRATSSIESDIWDVFETKLHIANQVTSIQDVVRRMLERRRG